MRQQAGFTDWYGMNKARHGLLYRNDPVDIPGISEKLEDRRTDLEVHRDRYVNRLDSAQLKLQVTARSPEKAAVSAAQDAENFSYELMDDFRSRRTDHVFGPHRRRIDQAVSYGGGVLHLDFSDKVRSKLRNISSREELKEKIAALQRDGFTENPFVLECPDINAVAFDPDFSRVCEVGEKTVAVNDLPEDMPDDIRSFITSDMMDEGRGLWQHKVKGYHLETGKFIYDVIAPSGDTALPGQGWEIERRPNPLGRPWYTFTPGQLTSERNVAEAFRPLIAPLYPIAQLLQILGTLLMSGALQTGRVAYQLVADGKRGAENYLEYMQMPVNERPVVRYDLTEDAIVQPPPGFHYEAFPVPDQNWLLNAYNVKREELREYGFPAVLDPSAPIDATSGYDRARQMEAAANFLDPPLKNIAAADHELLTLVADIIKELDLTITIPVRRKAQGEETNIKEQVKVTAKTFREQDVTVSYESIPETVRFAQRESDLRLRESGHMSRATFMAKLHEDPVAEDERIKFEVLEEQIDALAQQIAMAILQDFSQDIKRGAGGGGGLPVAQPVGGPAEPGGIRAERPPEAMPGVGAPLVPPEQPQEAGGMPPSMGTEIMAGAP